ncbi:MAG TPA: helix-turn-helix transcriptional regulator [Rugosimonospora sp.]|nr:helix-turn-helix transcriptional regulator [Rugosimonospora sp.]
MPKQTRQPADPTTGPVARFGFDLRTLRQTADLTYAQVAALSYFSKSAVHAADQGHQLPSRKLTQMFARACGADKNQVEDWVRRREEIAKTLSADRVAGPKPTPQLAGAAPPKPTDRTTPAAYNDGLKALREWSGLTFRRLGEISAEYDRPLHGSTLCTALGRGTLPAKPMVTSFLRAVNLSEPEQQRWLDVWQAINDGDPVRAAADATPRRRWTTGGYRIIPRTTTGHDTTDVAYTIPYASSEIRDWVLEDGTWVPTDPEPVVRPRVIVAGIVVTVLAVMIALVVLILST